MKSLIIIGLLFNFFGALYLFRIPDINKFPDTRKPIDWKNTSLEDGKGKIKVKLSKSQKRYRLGWGLISFGFLLEIIGTIF